MSLTNIEIQEITDYINSFRNLHNIPNLIYDSELSDIAQRNANKIVKYKRIINGEDNLYTKIYNLTKICKNNKIFNIKKAIDHWYNENYYYNYNIHNNYNYVMSRCSNFTALIWKNSLSFGIGYAYVNGKSSICIYTSEKGNIINQYQENILPKTN